MAGARGMRPFPLDVPWPLDVRREHAPDTQSAHYAFHCPKCELLHEADRKPRAWQKGVWPKWWC
eukprot:5110368-Alexandrium_andersonii.AAC.1